MKTIENHNLALLMEGFTHFVDIGKGEDAAIYYDLSQNAHMRLPGGVVMHGAWRMLADGYHVKWQDGPEGKWQIAHAPGAFVYINPEGKEAGKVTRIMPGDVAHLA